MKSRITDCSSRWCSQIPRSPSWAGRGAARQAGEDVLSARYPFNDHGKSMILGSRHGFVKLLARRRTGELLGGACVGPEAGELIHG